MLVSGVWRTRSGRGEGGGQVRAAVERRRAQPELVFRSADDGEVLPRGADEGVVGSITRDTSVRLACGTSTTRRTRTTCPA